MSRSRRHVLTLAGLILTGVGIRVALLYGGGSIHPGGADVEMWGLEAYNLLAGAPASLPPLYPALVAIALPVSPDIGGAGMAVSGLFAVLLGPLVYAFARRIGAPFGPALLAGLLVNAHPLVAHFGSQLQPEAATAVAFLATAWAAVSFLERPHARQTGAIVLAGTLLPMLREHGLILSVLLAGVLLLGRAPWWLRLLRAAALLALVPLAPVLFGQPVMLPWEVPWFQRMSRAVVEGGAGVEPSFLKALGDPRERSQVAALFQAKDTLGIRWFYVTNSLKQAAAAWLWLAVGLLALPRLRPPARRGLLVALLPPLSALLVFSQARHVGVAVPVAGVAWAGAFARNGTRPHGAVSRWLLPLAGLACVGCAAVRWPHYHGRHRHQVARTAEGAAFGEALCRHARPGDVGAGRRSAFLYCPLPAHAPQPEVTAADWRAWWVGIPTGRDGWRRVDVGNGLHPVYRLLPELEGEDRPCSGSVAAPGLPRRTSNARAARLVPPCDPLPPGMEARIAAHPGPVETEHRPREGLRAWMTDGSPAPANATDDLEYSWNIPAPVSGWSRVEGGVLRLEAPPEVPPYPMACTRELAVEGAAVQVAASWRAEGVTPSRDRPGGGGVISLVFREAQEGPQGSRTQWITLAGSRGTHPWRSFRQEHAVPAGMAGVRLCVSLKCAGGGWLELRDPVLALVDRAAGDTAAVRAADRTADR